MNTRRSPEDVKVFDVHSHPTNAFDDVFGCGNIDGVPTRRGPWDTLDVRRVNYTKRRDIDKGGGSDNDWIHWRFEIPENNAALSKEPPGPLTVGGIVINADGEVWIALPELLSRDVSDWHSNRRSVRWMYNYKNPSCDWRAQ